MLTQLKQQHAQDVTAPPSDNATDRGTVNKFDSSKQDSIVAALKIIGQQISIIIQSGYRRLVENYHEAVLLDERLRAHKEEIRSKFHSHFPKM